MTDLEIYLRNIDLLDNFYETARDDIKTIPKQDDWRKKKIYEFFKQSTHVMFCILSNSEKSKFRNPTYVTDLILTGSLGRLLRDIYVNIIYLKSNDFTEEQVRACWDFQVICQELKLFQYETDKDFIDHNKRLEENKLQLLAKIPQLNSPIYKDILKGKTEKLITLERLAEIKVFDKAKFVNEFSFFSQFSHSTAYANSFVDGDILALNILGIVYDKLVAYFISIVVESVELFLPNHPELAKIKIAYDEIVKKRWN